jgi:hypothetical protein
MISRLLLAVGLAVLMVISGISSYVYLGSRQSKLTAAPQVPTSTTPNRQAFGLSGTLYLTQSGAIYSLSGGLFHQLTPPTGWTQLAPYPGGNLLAVKRSLLYSDIYVLSRVGGVLRRVTNNNAAASNPDPGARHWSFYPRLSPNQKTLYMSYDKPKFGFDVPMSIWAMPLGGTIAQGKLWTTSNDYTGGDIQPLPLASGALIYTKYLVGPDLKLVGQIWLTPSAGAAGRALTTPAEDCMQPALSPNGRMMAMICIHEAQVSYLTLATFNGSTLGPRKTLISNQLVAQPTWAPDGSGIAYLAPAVLGTGFQLWWLPQAAYTPPTPPTSPTPSRSLIPTPGGPVNSPVPSSTPSAAPPPVAVKPLQITTDLGFDATSPMVWIPNAPRGPGRRPAF